MKLFTAIYVKHLHTVLHCLQPGAFWMYKHGIVFQDSET